VRDGKSGRVAFERVRAFLFASRVPVAVSGVGTITADVSYGGAFYALADAAQFGLDVRTSRVRDLVDAATALTEAVRASVSLSHPEHDDLAFLYGSILTDGRERQDSPFGNVDWYRNYSAVSGACQMLRRDVFDQIGGFNEQLEPELSSVDLCLRVLAQGYRNFYTPYARLGYYLRRRWPGCRRFAITRRSSPCPPVDP
jgi:hypothetical protein